MSSISTCPACNYTRQPTDTAPDWACPKCHKAYLKTSKLKSGFCKKHPSDKAIWRCKSCGEEFCGVCVKHSRQLKPLVIQSIPIAVCPECRGECFDFEYSDKLENDQIAASRYYKKQNIVVLAVVIIILLYFPVNFYLGKRAGVADAKRELPTLKWHMLNLYGPQDDPPDKNLLIVIHRKSGRAFSMYIQGYVAGHNEVVQEYISNKKKQGQ